MSKLCCCFDDLHSSNNTSYFACDAGVSTRSKCDFRFTMGCYPANIVAANIKDHYTVFAPLLNKARCIWDQKDEGVWKRNSQKESL